ncbi:PKD_channel domain-containing protein [Haematococcus lacustris]|uniref:PKD_channel domain-containing protein n=1 Tax=Haematococcus lacustris TaxID=44745 RepID=A0A699Z9P2_HAELA|nr:PKD_channel domain-containing protein [Haematococcus lacustris]
MVTGMLTTVMLGSQYADEGATAYDMRTGQPGLRIDLTARIKVTYPVAIDTSAPTDPAKPYLVLYDVSDDATPPNKAQQVLRRVQVVCSTGEVLCPGTDDPNLLSCSFNRICGLGPSTSSTSTTASSTALAPPALTLLGPSVIRIRQGAPYIPCSGGEVRGCEQGAAATRQVHGDMNAEIR